MKPPLWLLVIPANPIASRMARTVTGGSQSSTAAPSRFPAAAGTSSSLFGMEGPPPGPRPAAGPCVTGILPGISRAAELPHVAGVPRGTVTQRRSAGGAESGPRRSGCWQRGQRSASSVMARCGSSWRSGWRRLRRAAAAVTVGCRRPGRTPLYRQAFAGPARRRALPAGPAGLEAPQCERGPAVGQQGARREPGPLPAPEPERPGHLLQRAVHGLPVLAAPGPRSAGRRRRSRHRPGWRAAWWSRRRPGTRRRARRRTRAGWRGCPRRRRGPSRG